MADSLDALDRHIARVRGLRDIAQRAAPEIAPLVAADLRANIARGVGPDGTAWKLTQDGRRALQNAAKAITVSPVGTAVVATVKGIEARHHHGWVRGGVARPILPSSITAPIAKACRDVATRIFRTTMGGR